MPQAIVTKYRGPTDRSGPRVVATCQARRCTLAYEHSLSLEGNEIEAARQLAESLGWGGPWYSGRLPDGRAVFVQGQGIDQTAATFEARPTGGAQPRG